MIWPKLNYLVPEPQCETREDEILNWKDSRPQPTQAELDAVTQAQIDSTKKESRLRGKFTSREDTSLLLYYKIDKRLRVLEGKPAITKEQFWNGVKTIHKNEQFFDF